MDLATIAGQRYTTKAYDPEGLLAPDQVEELLELLRQAPSSVNAQPWHFVIASDAAGKARVATAADGPTGYNGAKIVNASHVLVLCARTEMSEAHLAAVLEREEAEGRFVNADAKAGQDRTRRHYVDIHRYEQKDLQHWMEKQVYLALGSLLLGAAALGIDATPMEGFDSKALDLELGLREQGLTSVVLVALGRRAESDFNAKLPKSRLSAEQVFTRL